jgi:hypothetical protein
MSELISRDLRVGNEVRVGISTRVGDGVDDERHLPLPEGLVLPVAALWGREGFVVEHDGYAVPFFFDHRRNRKQDWERVAAS